MILGKFANKSFFVRLTSGIVLVAIMILTIVPGGYPLFILNLLLSLVATYELLKTMSIEKTPFAFTAYVVVAAYYALIITGFDKYNLVLLVAGMIVMLAFYVFKFPKYKTEIPAKAYFALIYGGIMLSFLYLTRISPNGQYVVWLIFLCSWACDTCAYAVGVAIGKHKMAPVLSPKKSVEGAVGGVVGAAGLGAIYGAVFADKLNLLIHPAIAFAIICAIGGLVSMVGDLAASAVKRDHNIKDYGNIIPGHGGIMDRFDSVIYVAPIIWFLVQVMS